MTEIVAEPSKEPKKKMLLILWPDPTFYGLVALCTALQGWTRKKESSNKHWNWTKRIFKTRQVKRERCCQIFLLFFGSLANNSNQLNSMLSLKLYSIVPRSCSILKLYFNVFAKKCPSSPHPHYYLSESVSGCQT